MTTSFSEFLTTHDLSTLFDEETRALGGDVRDRFDDGQRLICRAVLPHAAEVAPGDGVRGGVALFAADGQVRVHPYVFRLVCTNGAVRAHAHQARWVSLPTEPYEVETFHDAVREAVRLCGTSEALAAGAAEMRGAAEANADMALTVMPMLAQIAPEMRAHLLATIFQRFQAEGGRSRFALMNAVTSVARDTKDPDLRWRLEELGGGIPVAVTPPPRPPRAARRHEAVREVEEELAVR